MDRWRKAGVTQVTIDSTPRPVLKASSEKRPDRAAAASPVARRPWSRRACLGPVQIDWRPMKSTLPGPAGIDDAAYLYHDHDLASGVHDDRPGLDSCLRALCDVLIVWKLDRLGPEPRRLGQHGAGPVGPVGWACGCSPATGRRSTPPIAAGRLVFGIFAALAEFERELISPVESCGSHTGFPGHDRRTGLASLGTWLAPLRRPAGASSGLLTPWRRRPRGSSPFACACDGIRAFLLISGVIGRRPLP